MVLERRGVRGGGAAVDARRARQRVPIRQSSMSVSVRVDDDSAVA